MLSSFTLEESSTFTLTRLSAPLQIGSLPDLAAPRFIDNREAASAERASHAAMRPDILIGLEAESTFTASAAGEAATLGSHLPAV